MLLKFVCEGRGRARAGVRVLTKKEKIEKDSEGEGVCWHAVYTVTSSPV